MNSKIKNGKKRTVRCEFTTRTKTNIFEKKPTKGGTPARDKRDSEITFVRTFVDPKSEREKRDLMPDPTDWSTVVKSRNDVTL